VVFDETAAMAEEFIDADDAQPTVSSEPAECVVEIDGLYKSYGDKEAVRGISLRVGSGEVFGLLGPNGAGKTTTLECAVGLRQPTAGTIRVLGLDPATATAEFRRAVAVQPQEGALFPNLKVRETLELWSSFYPAPEDVDEVLTRVGLTEQRDRKVKALSGGQRRRLLLAVTIIGRPQVLVLDEPSAGLDPQAREHLWDVIRSHRADGSTVLLTTHDMNEAARLCDRLAVIVAGRIAATGTPAQLVRQLSINSTVSFTTPSVLGVIHLRSLDGVTAVETAQGRGGTSVQVTTSQPDVAMRYIAGHRGLRASELSIQQGSLDDVFRKLATASDTEGSGS
jgi:ABC-2 type transport system ATP-binding protein